MNTRRRGAPALAPLLLAMCAAAVVGDLACGGSAIRPPEGDPDPPPPGEPDPGAPDPDRAADAGSSAPPDAAASEDAAADAGEQEDVVSPPPDLPVADTVVPASCGGVRCPRLFDIVTACRPAGACMSRMLPTSQHRCYDNGVKVVATADTGAGFSANVTQPDGMTACYRVEVSRSSASGNTNFIWRDPDGLPIATGVTDGEGRRTITCDGLTSELTDPGCLALPSADDCPAGSC